MRPRALRTSMPARSNTSSPDTPVSAGHTGGGAAGGPVRDAGVAGAAVAAASEGGT
ncbi:hypothetical protein D3C84_1057290 [compost metagenome]